MKKNKSKYFSTDKVMPRFFALAVIFVILATVIVARAGILMFGEKHDYWMDVSKQFKKYDIPIPAKRGTIYSSDGQILSTTLPEYRMFMDFMSWEEDSVRRLNDQMDRDRLLYLKLDSVCMSMHEMFPDIDPEEFKEHMLEGRAQKSHHWPLYKKRITYVELCEVKKMPFFSERKCGFHTENFERRRNPYGNLAHATVGIYDEERDSLKTGLELALDTLLRGKPGVAHKEKVLNRYVQKEDKPAEDGLDVVATIDVRMQDLVEETLGDKLRELEANVGMCILMDVQTGDVKAISSLTRCNDGVYREVDNRALYSHREPGSVFKPMAFMVGFEDGVIDLNSGFNVGCGVREMYGRKMRDSDAHRGGKNRWISAVECIKYSSNVGVSALIDQAYHNDPVKFIDGLDRIGIRTDLKLPLKEYNPPVIRYPQKDEHGHWTNWWETAIPWMSIGYETQIPPIQTLTFYNAVANDGKMVKPRFFTCAKRGDEVVQEFPVEYIHADRPDTMMCSKESLKKVRTCLEAVVAKSDCTGKDVYTPTFPIAGKTGTAQIWNNTGRTSTYIVSFAGYFPANAPRYSMIVCLEKDGTAYGGAMCGPVFKKIAETIWADEHRSSIDKARDESEASGDAPVVCNGNLESLTSVLNTLNVQHTTTYNGEKGILWGSDTSNDARKTTLTADAADDKNMPNLNGYGLRDAVFRMESMGLKVKASGYGRVVSQSIAAGSEIKPGQVVELTLATTTKAKPRPKIEVAETTAEAPSADSTPATTEGTAPANDAATPATDAAKPAADAAKPAKDAPKPANTPAKPKADANKPKADANKPKADANKPKTDANKPKADANKPKADANKPKTDANKPKTDVNKPKTDANKPKTDANKKTKN